jgi:hypothetical protein
MPALRSSQQKTEECYETSLRHRKHIKSRKDIRVIGLAGMLGNYKCWSDLTVYTPAGDDKDWDKRKVAESG